MPLHDWTDRGGWDGMHHLWITELLRWVKPRLPDGYRAYIGTAPLLAVGSPGQRPDVAVRQWESQPPSPESQSNESADLVSADIEPDVEVAVAAIDPGTALLVESHGRLVAAVELISPRNKDRPIARSAYFSRYLGYLLDGANLLLVDVHRRPLDFSFADRIAQELQIEQPACPTPLAVSYRVGEPAATGGHILAIWRRELAVGNPLPVLPLPLSVEAAVSVDLEQTYARAAADAYLD